MASRAPRSSTEAVPDADPTTIEPGIEAKRPPAVSTPFMSETRLRTDETLLHDARRRGVGTRC
jgi:hypothetical protein